MHQCTSELQSPAQVPRNTNGDLENEVTITNSACATIDITPLILNQNDVDQSKMNISSDITKTRFGKEDYMPSPMPLQVDGGVDVQYYVLLHSTYRIY